MSSPEPYIACRTCTEINPSTPDVQRVAESREESQPIENFAQEDAFVLLGAPGSGKTEEFKRQAKLSGGHYVPARNFLALGNQPELRSKTLFIDGLDEVRAGVQDGRTPFDAIRNKLQQLDRPRFRLSCREADWFGSNDRRHLESVAPSQTVRVLRLDPLSVTNVGEILQRKFELSDPDEFIELAEQRGVQALLENPLSLRLLVKAVRKNGKNRWPKSRSETFEMACRTLARENNREHLQAIPNRSSQDDILRAAGQLCAIQLLAGAHGIRRLPGAETENDGCIDLSEISGVSQSLVLESLGTRIFDGHNGAIVAPIHRQIAEFLGARYLGQLVRDGLPPRRILALMSGFDGMIVTELRGLGAWLATLCGIIREEFITHDPLGTVLYGDVAHFPVQVKERILRELEKVSKSKESHWFLDTIEFDSRLGDLLSTELAGIVLEILEDPARDSGRQSLTLFLVKALCYAQPLKDMAPALMEMIRDGSRRTSIRQNAIRAFLRQREDERQAFAELKSLMREVRTDQVPDSTDELLGHLLECTYPDALPGTEVLDYFRTPKSSQHSWYSEFWTWTLPERSSLERKMELLDKLAADYAALGSDERQSDLHGNVTTELPIILLDSVLSDSSASEKLTPERLFAWLGVAGRWGDLHHSWGILHEKKIRVQTWLGDRPELWKALLKLGLEESGRACQATDSADFQRSMGMEEDRRLFGAKRPPDFAKWCLDEALAAGNADAAKWLVRRVADEIEGERISKSFVDSRLEGNDFLRNVLQERADEHEEWRTWEARQENRHQDEEVDELSQLQSTVRKHRTELTENRAPMPLLYRLARSYFGGYVGNSEYTPHERLDILLGNDGELIETVLTGLRETVFRTDLPTIEQVIRLSTEGNTHYLSLPFLAGFNEIHESSVGRDTVPDENQNRLAAAIYYNQSFWPNPWGYGETQKNPRWLKSLLVEQPELIADILIKSISPGLRKSQDFSGRLYELVYSNEYEEVARIVATPMLRSFPVRCTERQLPGLRFLLIAAERHCPKDIFIKMVKEKLGHASMNVAQRVYWLAAGLVSSPQCFSDSLREYVAGNVRRVRHLSAFIGGRFDQFPVQPDRNDVSAIAALIQLLGAMYPPGFFNPELDTGAEDDGGITWGMDISYRIDSFVHQLMENPSHNATQELQKLAKDKGLGIWRTRLELAVGKQKGIRREASFKRANVSTILGVLDNRQPANPADLAALTMDRLCEIATRIRHDNTSDWRQYWNVYSQNIPERPQPAPRPEDVCRDALLSDLRQILAPISVDAEPEGRYADDKRADIRVSYCGRFNVPIEIKKSCSRDLWSAIKSQLILKYTRDPGTDGYGIYLVFWFGNHNDCWPTSDAGPPPKSANELKHRLEDSLSDAERLKISVCVIDVEDRKSQREPKSSNHE